MTVGTMDAAMPRQIGAYRCLARVACGGAGTVWRALMPNKPLDVAIKVLHPNLAKSRVARADFAREYSYGRRFGHPGLLRFYGYGKHEGCPYIVMEYFHSTTLKALINGKDRGKLLGMAESLIRQVVKSLIPVHAAGVVHRDIKPDNILIGIEGFESGELETRVIDFSMAISGWRRWLPWGRRAAGTPTYVAPEIIVGKTPTTASDVYSFGATLYEMFAGRPPFLGNTQQEVLQQRLKTKPEPLHRKHDGITDAFSRLVMSMLEKDPGSRPADMGMVYRQFDRLDGIFLDR